MKIIYLAVMILFLSVGCARVRVEAPKDPIKLDISMRLDIYQHVAKDIDAIEDIVSGSGEKTPSSKQGSMLYIFVESAYAEDSFGPEVEKAAISRRDRRPQLVSLEGSGVVAENNLGLVEIRGGADPSVMALVDAENSDRMVIYKAIAAKNGISVEEVQGIYAKKLQDNMAGK
jgi:uncharacterized protein YdbL (DUF1318 family)